MDREKVPGELAHTSGVDLKLSDAGSCGMMFDNDGIIFERHGETNCILSLGSASGREDACNRMVCANYIVLESGQTTNDIVTIDTRNLSCTECWTVR
ncbi:MAG: hypothetical protein K5657_08120 [Desulfovibrio sp.]|nr:hypothetical protein [Desulfovibrio sp.]